MKINRQSTIIGNKKIIDYGWHSVMQTLHKTFPKLVIKDDVPIHPTQSIGMSRQIEVYTFPFGSKLFVDSEYDPEKKEWLFYVDGNKININSFFRERF